MRTILYFGIIIEFIFSKKQYQLSVDNISKNIIPFHVVEKNRLYYEPVST